MKEERTQRGHPGKTAFLSLYTSLIFPAFITFRLFYIPAAMLTHSGHGMVWLNALLGLLLTFGGEWLGRRNTKRRPSRRQDLVAIILSLLIVGLIPEESPIGLLLWAAIGLAWGERWRGLPFHPTRADRLIGLFLGAAIGLSGLLGPGSWLMALVLLPLLWMKDMNDPPATTLNT